MNDIDLRTALHDWAGEAPAGQPPVAELISRGARRQRRRTLAGAGTAAVAVLGAGAMAIDSLSAGPTGAGPAVTPPEPGVELAAAVTSTSGQSFRFVVESALTVPAHGIQASKGRCSGMIDPATQTGYVKLGDLNEHWAVGGKRYLRAGKHHYTLGAGDVNQFIACPVGRTGDPGFVSADPVTLLRVLTKLSTVEQISGGETSRYAFTGSGFRGTVTVSGSKVRSLTSTVDSPARDDAPAYHREITLTLSGHGEPVAVRPPW
jgi:hypothetical protein